MAQALTLARPYARAAFELAQAQGALPAWSAQLGFAAAVAVDPRVTRLGNDPRVKTEQLVALHLPPDVGADRPFARFLGELATHRRLRLLPEVAVLFEALKREAESRLKVRVSSARPLDEGQAQALQQALQRRYKREIELDVCVDPALLGGAVIDTGEQVIDGSARGQLARLAGTLAH